MAESRGYPKNFFKANEIIQGFAGLWIFERKKVSTPWKIARYFYSSILYGMTLSFLVAQFVMFKETVKEIQKLIRHLDIVGSHILCFMKLATLNIQYGKLQRIIDVLQDDDLYYDAVGDFEPLKMFERGKRTSQLVATMAFGFYSFVGISAYISTQLNINVQTKETPFVANSSCYDYLLCYFYIPFPSDTKRKCDAAIFFMGYSLTACGWIIASHDMLYVSLVNCLKTHLLIVCEAIRTIRKRTLVKIGLSEEVCVFRDEEIPELDVELCKELRRISKHLTILLDVAVELETTFHLILLGQILISIISLASSLFIANTVPLGSPECFSQFEYFVALVIQLGIFCVFGESIRESSQEVSYALYECDWLSSSKRFKSMLLTTMIRMQRPLSLTFGKFCPATLASWVAVLKCSFSYYTVFKTIDE